MLILGINAFHADSAACLLDKGQLVAAAEEERFRRIKHWAGLPTHAIEYCLQEARRSLADIDYVAINRDPRANAWRRLLFLLRHRPAFNLVRGRLTNILAAQSIGVVLARCCGGELRGKVHHIEHHRAHLASAYFASGYQEAVCVSVDGCGDFASTAWGLANGQLYIDERIYFPHSLGIFYSMITQFLGFHSFGDEYKMMGLAAYGQPRYLKEMRAVLKLKAHGRFKLDLRFFRHHAENVSYRWNDCAPELGTLYTAELECLLGPARQKREVVTQKHQDIAASAQAIYEEAFFALLNEAHRRYRCSNLALAGGCALNSVANGKIYARTPFRSIYVPPAAADAGGAIGAALVVWHNMSGAGSGEERAEDKGHHIRAYATRLTHHSPRIPDQDYAYPGPHFEDATIACLLTRRGLLNPAGCYRVIHHEVGSLCATTAEAIAAGNIVGWFQGRTEWGPRALGNRSILCDPRRADIKQILNAKIKRRESFRPFAPAILRAHVAEWFEQDADVPFMSAVFSVRREKRDLIPAVTHIDGSGRLQTVHEKMNPLFHLLISEFHALTSVPLILNTSFNEQEPIVCHPEEALDCFLRTKMDVLVLGGFLITRHSQP